MKRGLSMSTSSSRRSVTLFAVVCGLGFLSANGFLVSPLFHQARSMGGMRSLSMAGPMESTIGEKLGALEPQVLQVINESHMHAGNAPETHFKVVVVSEKFEGMRLLQRHRMVNEILAEQLNSGLHALSIVSKTPEQWEGDGGAIPKSPDCLGGGKNWNPQSED